MYLLWYGRRVVNRRTSPDDELVLAAFGERMRELRSRAGLTQDGLADAAGMDRKTVNRMEMGRHSPNIPALLALASALAVLPGALLDPLADDAA